MSRLNFTGFLAKALIGWRVAQPFHGWEIKKNS